MPRDPRAYLWDVREAAQNVESFLADVSLETYASSVLLRSAVERQLEIIGEALGQMSKVAPEIAAGIPELRRIVAFRNLLVHGYAVVNHEIVWRTAREKLPDLRAAVQRQIDALDRRE
jgi:uncharacterized protein with HEPN domain